MKLIIAYGSSTGNTAKIAAGLASVFREKGMDVAVKTTAGIKAADLQDYDVVLLGSSTWGLGSLQESVKPMFLALSDVNLEGKLGGAFGCGDAYSYPRTFCKAVDLLQKRLKDCGVKLVQPGLKVNGDIESSKDMIAEWAQRAADVIAVMSSEG